MIRPKTKPKPSKFAVDYIRSSDNPIGFWKQIYGSHENGREEAQQVYLNLFSGFRPSKKNQEPGEQNKNKLTDIEERYFSWPKGAEKAARWAQQESRNGREVYQCSHLLTDKKRVKENAVPPKSLYSDGDGAKIPVWMPPPNVVIESSPERQHYYWTLTESMAPEAFEELNRKVTYAIGADKGKWGLTTLLRVPGTKNYKYVDTPVVGVEKLEDMAYNPSDIYRSLPSLKDEQDHKAEEEAQGQSKPSFDGSADPPVKLDDYGMSVWCGEKVKLNDDGSLDRSASLLNMGRVLHDGGATRRTIVEALEERDKSLGWDKYTSRKDSKKQYERIVDVLEGSDGKLNTNPILSNAKRKDTLSIGERVLLGEAIQRGIEPPEELIQGILLKGKVHQVFAAPGCGKSWLALWLTKMLINEGKPVLYLDTENGTNIIAERLKALDAETEKVDEYLYYYSSPNLPMTTEGVEAYVRLLEEVDPALVVFDSWVNFLSGAGLDENVSSEIAKWSFNFARPARDKEITVLLLDHVPKEKTNARGSGRKKEEMDVQWQLKNEKPFDRNNIGEIKLIREKDREGWLPHFVRFSVGGMEDGFVFEEKDEFGGIAKVQNLNATEKKISNLLKDTFENTGATASEWQKACEEQEGIKRASFYRARKNLIEGEHYFKEGDRFYPQDPQEEEEGIEW